MLLTISLMLALLGAPVPSSGRSSDGATVRWGRTDHVVVGRRRVVTGRVDPDAAGRVTLQLLTRTGWYDVAASTASDRGRFRLRVPTSWYGTHRYRVTTRPDASGPTHVLGSRRLTVLPSYRPSGRPAQHELTRWRWDPCTPVGFRVSTTNAPDGALAMVRRAVRMTARASGLTFRYLGPTTATPTRSPGWWRQAPLVFGWATGGLVDALQGTVVGVGGPYLGEVLSDGWFGISGSYVLIDVRAGLARGFGAGATYGEVILHELGHAVGLDHAFDTGQVMDYGALPVDRWGAGDIAGLQRVGLEAGCITEEEVVGRALRASPRP